MPAGQTDLLEVVVLASRPYALLTGGGTDIIALLLSQKNPLELHHPGVGEEQGGVILGRERRRGHQAVPPSHKKIEEETSDGTGFHGGNIQPRTASTVNGER